MKLGFIGVGKMGSALLEGVLNAKVCTSGEVVVHDAFEPAATAISKKLGVTAVSSCAEVFELAETVVICVKPQDVQASLKGAANVKTGRLVVSIAAGIGLRDLETWAAKPQRVVRVMPNTPALIGKGASGFALGSNATESDATTVQTLLESVGIAVSVKESQLDAVTGLSGSGPAYVFTIIEALADGGVLEGLPKPLALQLAAQTLAGAAELALQSGEHPAVLRDNVTSPGGTTIAGLAELEKNGIRSALIEAVREATRRSRELGK
tara:strand:- start:537 stop:1334 length:798 start_codon:yes stop_codon:yes gene_type:complete